MCRNPRDGILTLIIIFLPGIHWYSVVKTKKRKLEKFLAAIFFPIFMVVFKIGHLFQQGPLTAELNLLVDSCVAINEDMIQLVLQISVLFRTYETKGITTLQSLVISWSLIMAAKAAAEEFLVSKLKRVKKKEGSTKLYHEITLKTKLSMLAKQMPFYILLTTFRVLSMGLIITVFNYFSIIIYVCLFLAIIIIGYLNTWKGKEFLTRGFRSSLTTVDDRYFGEKIFQTFWFCINIAFISYIALDAHYLNLITPETMSRNVVLLNSVIGVIMGTGSLSFSLFFVLRHNDDKSQDKNLFNQETTDDNETEYLYTRLLTDLSKGKGKGKVKYVLYYYCESWKNTGKINTLKSLCINLINLSFTLLEYINTLLLCIEYLQDAHPIWGIVTAVIPFLPGIEWELVGPRHKLTWFLSSLLFPFTVISSRVVAVFAPTDSLYEINRWINGPRMQWGRVPQLSLQLFIIFNKVEIFNSQHSTLWLAYFSLGLTFLTVSIMDSEQTIFRKRESRKTRKLLDAVKIFPLCFVTIVFRIFSFSVILSLFHYLAIPLYFLLILISILLQKWQNPESSSFIMEGTKSIFTMANKEYKDEVTFQVYWFVCNIILTLTLTFVVKMGPGFGEATNLGDLGIWNLGLYNYLEFDNRFIAPDIAAFNAIVVTICSTGLVSLGTFFVWKKFRIGENVTEVIHSEEEASKSEDGVKELGDTHTNNDECVRIEEDSSIPLNYKSNQSELLKSSPKKNSETAMSIEE